MKIGGLFFGYGGLDLAVQNVIPDAHLAWYSEFDKGANKIAAHRFPGVPNHGDITKIDWADVEPVDILTGGSPCQDLSHAGKRAGMTDGTRSNLWVAMREAIAQLRPRLVVWENVRGAYSAEADSDLEHCPGCMGDGRPGTVLRALGRVLGDLSDLGYDALWHGLRAADVGAPHGRMRVFVIAEDASGVGEPSRTPAPLPKLRPRDAPLRSVRPTRGPLLPTPAVNDMGAGKSLEWWDDWTDRMKAEHGNGNGHGPSLAIELQRWEDYTAALRVWAGVLGRDHPYPLAPDGTTSPAFVEWMMGLPAGHVTEVPGVTSKQALKALGNGVCPQQAEAALRFAFGAASVGAVAS